MSANAPYGPHSEQVPVNAVMVALAVCKVPTDAAMEVLRLARHLRDHGEPPNPEASNVVPLR